MRKALLIAVSGFVLVLPAAAANISGTWTINGDVVGNPISMKCAFTQDGMKISGTCTGALGSTATTGSIAENKVTFQHTVEREQVYQLTYSGTLDAAGTSMQGEIAVAGVTGTFSGAKDPAEAAKSAANDISGTWTITGEVVGNAINMKCALKPDGARVSGICKYQDLGDSPTTGSIAGNKITLQNTVQREQQYDLTYTGTLDATGTAISGEIAVAGVTGSFSGAKDK